MNKIGNPVKQFCPCLTRTCPEEQSLQCAGRSGHSILLLHGIDRDFSAVAEMTGNQRYGPGNQTVDQSAERDSLSKPMLPESIHARHEKNAGDTGSNTSEPKPCLSHDSRKAVPIEMIDMPRRIQLEPPGAEQLEL